MTPEQASRVGERFYRANTSGNIPGTGLGKFIVKEILELHGGSLSVTAPPGEGSTATLWLPAALTDGDGRATSKSPVLRMEIMT